MAIQALSGINTTGTRITNLPSPVAGSEPATKDFASNADNLANGTLAVARGGTGQTSYTDGQLLIGNTTGNTLAKGTLTAGTGIIVTNGGGSIALSRGVKTTSLKVSAYTVISTDHDTVINCTGSFTVSLTALASLSAGFTCWIWNLGTASTDVITIDPSGSEQIDGLSTLVLYRGEGVEIINATSGWRTLATRHRRGISENIAEGAVRPVASGDSSVALGASAVASGQYSFAAGQDSSGNGPTAGGIGSVALGGGYVDTLDGFASGPYSTTRLNRGCVARASGRITTTGDAQARTLTLRGQTTSATPLVLTTDAGSASSSNIIRMPNNAAYTFTITVIAHRTDVVGTYASYQFTGCVTRGANAASTAIRGTVIKTVLFETDTAYDCDVTADTTNGGAIVTVTGKASQTVTWCARVETVEATS